MSIDSLSSCLPIILLTSRNRID